MKFDINALIQKQKRPIKDKKQLSAELKKTIEQEEDPRIQKHKINALKRVILQKKRRKLLVFADHTISLLTKCKRNFLRNP